MPFDYYQRLSSRDRATYRRSDAIGEIVVPDPGVLAPHVEAVRTALADDDRPALNAAAGALVRALVRGLGAPPVKVRVLARRPSDATSELHGLYVSEEGRTPLIRVWMRTAAHLRPVAFRTFLRTLLHEVCHHLDYAHLGLEDSFHTEGFFRRESSLMRAIAPRPEKRKAAPAPIRGPRRPSQLALPLAADDPDPDAG